jgi:hypothetical protein
MSVLSSLQRFAVSRIRRLAGASIRGAVHTRSTGQGRDSRLRYASATTCASRLRYASAFGAAA